MRALRTLLGLVGLCYSAVAVGASPIATDLIPQTAPIGARAVVVGTGLDSTGLAVLFTAANNTTTAAPLVAVSSTILELSVPSGATSGPVSVQLAGAPIATLQFSLAPTSTFADVTTLAGGPSSDVYLKQPFGDCVTANGVTYLADSQHNQIRSVTATGQVSILAGTGQPGYVDGTVSTAQFKNPSGVAFNQSALVLYVADTGNDVIRQIKADGSVTTLAGSGKDGYKNGAGPAAAFSQPTALALDQNGNLLVADAGNAAIRRVTPNGVVSTVAGTGKPGYVDGTAGAAKFYFPAGIAVDQAGNILVADTDNNVIRMIAGGAVTTLAGTGHPGLVNGAAGQAQFKYPTGIGVDDAGNLFVGDVGNHVVRRIDRTTTPAAVATVAGTGNPGFSDGIPQAASFVDPSGITVSGAVYTADLSNNALRVIYPVLVASDLYPKTGPPAGGNSVQLFGQGFVPGSTAVTFGQTAASVTFVSSTELLVIAPPGAAGPIAITLTTPAGTASLTGYRYGAPPTIIGITPQQGRTAGGDPVTITGTNFLDGSTTVTFGGQPGVVTAVTGGTNLTVTTPPGATGPVDVVVRTAAGQATAAAGFTYLLPPTLATIAPNLGRIAGGDLVTLSGTNFQPLGQITVLIGGNIATILSVTGGTSISAITPPGAPGVADVIVRTAGGDSKLVGAFTYLLPPSVTNVSPAKGRTAGGDAITLTGANFPPIGLTAVVIGGQPATVTAIIGGTTIAVTTPAAPAGSADVLIQTPGGSAVLPGAFTYLAPPTITGFTPTTGAPGTAVTIQGTNFDPDATGDHVSFGPAPAATTGASASSLSTVVPAGAASGHLTVTTAGGAASSSATFSVATPIPPDPTTLAPPITPTIATSVASSTAFLYAGATPVQYGVQPGTINAPQAAVIRGLVKTSAGQPLSGVTVTILGHPEYGSTLTRNDGMFDLAVNGGALTVIFQSSGYPTLQREILVALQDFTEVPDVVMTSYDTTVTPITYSSTTLQVARGTRTSDADGARQATLLFKASTQASIVQPDGTLQPASTLHVRATEFTVGPTGLQAMPAALPANSGYTYAVEYSADEAPNATVTFSQPVIAYLENFVGFPSGTIVPVGYYDRGKGTWVPSQNGAVIKILSVSNGTATIDSNGDGQPDSATVLAALGITSDELQTLGSLYTAGQTLWRVPVPHFSPWDFNWPIGAPPDASPPPGNGTGPNGNNDPNPQPDDPQPPIDKPCPNSGSIIGCENQSLGESVPITGTPFTLNYHSDRAVDRKSAYTLTIPLSFSSVPADLKRIELRVQVAGRSFAQAFPPTPNQHTTFTWDGTDAYGREVFGQQTVHVDVGFVYQGVYRSPGTVGNSFGQYSGTGTPIVGTRALQEITLWSHWTGQLGAWDFHHNGLGGWTISAAHAYDPIARRLYYGTGGTRSVDATSLAMQTAAGSGRVPSGPLFAGNYGGDGGPATQALLDYPEGVAASPDGGYFIADTFNHVVRRVDPNGIISTFAGVPSCCVQNRGDGGPATQAQLRSPSRVAVGPDGSVYIADQSDLLIRKVTPDGVINTIAGDGTFNAEPNGVPATQTSIDPGTMAVGPDGSLYFSDVQSVRKVGTDGIITRVAGGGTPCPNPGQFTVICSYYNCSGDGGLATAASVLPEGIAVDRDGQLFIADANGAVRVVGTDGIIRSLVTPTVNPNTGNTCTAYGQFGQYAHPNAPIDNPGGIAIAADGTLRVYDGLQVLKVDRDHSVSVVAGNNQGGYSGDGGAAVNATLSSFNADIAITADQRNILIADFGSYRIRAVAPPLPGLGAFQFSIPAEDGSSLFLFDSSGQHLRTVNAVTGAVQYAFGYSSTGLLQTVTDGDGNVTTIEHAGNGDPSGVLAPGGQETKLGVDGNGYLSSITSPGGASIGLTNTSGGLLSQLQDQNHGNHTFSYDPEGRLLTDADPFGSSVTLARTGTTKSFTISSTTALGRTTKYNFVNGTGGTYSRSVVDPAGLTTTETVGPDGSRTLHQPDGTTITTSVGPDPRFGMQAPILTGLTLTTPGGLHYSLTRSRTATLGDPANPLSLTTQTDAITVNGSAMSLAFAATGRSYVAQSTAGRPQTTILDQHGRVASLRRGSLTPIVFSYDSQGRPLSIAQTDAIQTRKLGLTWNAKNELVGVMSPRNISAAFGYDPDERVVQVTPAASASPTAFSFDPAGNLTGVTPPSRPTHSFTYTSSNLAAGYQPPSLSDGAQPAALLYDKDKAGNVLTRADGTQISLTTDAPGRPSLLTTADGTYTVAYNANSGHVASLSTPAGLTSSFTFDGPIQTGESWSGPVSGAVSRTYDNNLREIGLQISQLPALTFGYDADGLLTKAGDLAITRDSAQGLATTSTLGNVSQSFSYDTVGLEASHTVTAQGATLFSAVISRDSEGRVLQSTETVVGITRTKSYEYDDLGQLTDVTVDATPTYHFVYDANGNRLSLTGPNGTIAGTFDSQDRGVSLGTTSYAYDLLGRLTSRGVPGATLTYGFDALGELTSVVDASGNKISYAYDGLGRRISRSLNGALTATYLYDGQFRPVALRDGTGSTIATFVYGNRISSPEYMVKNGIEYLFVYDATGNVRLVLNATDGSVLQKLEYGPLGDTVVDTNPGIQPFGFAGGLYDPGTGLVHFGARDYDPVSGRWLTKDPELFGGRNPNLYAYAANDPVNLYDPSGRWTISIGSTAAAGLVAIGQVGGGMFLNIGHSPSAGLFQGWSVSLTGTAEDGFGTGDTASAGVTFEYTNACDVSQLLGEFYQAGGGAGPLGYSGIRSPNGAVTGFTMSATTPGGPNAYLGSSETSALIQYSGQTLSLGATDSGSIISVPLGGHK